MNKYKTTRVSLAGLLIIACANVAPAAEVEILGAEFESSGANRWSVSVTLQHADTGWDHYADNWRVVDAEGRVLGDRVLYHPHVDEQPFTRSLSGVAVPTGTDIIFIEAHDKVHGWSATRLRVNLADAREGRLRVRANELLPD